ncbi:MAG: hypothetical protein JNL80_01185 [Phycisphaerae bacterium]|jgi:hypothetical protein|nr:hypothetical protein [Phycisphaerae bacterium]
MAKEAKKDDGKKKWGSGHMKAMAKQGLAELRGLMYTGSNVAQPTEYGIFGKETPSEVAASREGAASKDEPSVLDDALESAKTREAGEGRGDGRNMELDRD